MLVAFRSRPHGRQRHHVSEVEGRYRWLADIGVDMAGKAPEPSFDRVDRLGDAGEVAALDDLFDQPQFLLGGCGLVVPNRNSRGHISR
jgi:hypothetical protein